MEKKSFDMMSFGEIMLRLSPPQNERMVRGEVFEKRAGGSELNVASGISLLGLRTGIISKLPANDLGTYIKNRVRFVGVSDDYLLYDSTPGARLGVYYYESGAHPRKPSIVYDRMYSSINNISLEEIPEEVYTDARIFHTSGISLALSANTRAVAIELIKKFKAGGAAISFDITTAPTSGARTRPARRSRPSCPMWTSSSSPRRPAGACSARPGTFATS